MCVGFRKALWVIETYRSPFVSRTLYLENIAMTLVYIEWLSKFMPPDNNREIFKLNWSLEDGERVASAVPISTIRRGVHLFPKILSVGPGGVVPGQRSREVCYVLS